MRSAVVVVVIAPAAMMTACATPGAADRSRTLTVYGFSILGEVMTKHIFPAFAQKWQRDHGGRVELLGAFAGSGTITNQILFGAPAQVAILSHELDALRLREARIVRTDWRMFPHHGVINRTPFVIVTRPGNPYSGRFVVVAKHTLQPHGFMASWTRSTNYSTERGISMRPDPLKWILRARVVVPVHFEG